MRRNSLISSRRTRALRDRPATDTRLSPSSFPTRRWKVHRLHAAYPSPGSLPRLRPLKGVLTPGHRPGGRPDTLGSPEANAPRLDSPVASLGTPLSHGDGMEDTPDPLRRVGSVWGSYPFQDSPVFPLGDPCSPRDGREFALPSLRMVERLPHTDRPQGETPSSPDDLRVWRSLAPRPLRPGHGPSIAYFFLTSPLSLIPDSDRESMGGGSARPERSRRACPCEGRGTHPSGTITCDLATHAIPSLSTSTKLEGAAGAGAPAAPSVFPSPSPLKALRERGTKGERVSLWGWEYPLSVGATGGSPSPLRHAKSPEIPLGVVQSNQLRVQSMFNQRSIKTLPSATEENPPSRQSVGPTYGLDAQPGGRAKSSAKTTPRGPVQAPQKAYTGGPDAPDSRQTQFRRADFPQAPSLYAEHPLQHHQRQQREPSGHGSGQQYPAERSRIGPLVRTNLGKIEPLYGSRLPSLCIDTKITWVLQL